MLSAGLPVASVRVWPWQPGLRWQPLLRDGSGVPIHSSTASSRAAVCVSCAASVATAACGPAFVAAVLTTAFSATRCAAPVPALHAADAAAAVRSAPIPSPLVALWLH